MVTRAKIVKVISDKEVQVEVPMFGLIQEGEGEDQINELPRARISTTPGCSPNFKKNDVVLICIEDNDLNNPMVMGRLIADDSSVGTSNVEFDTAKINKDITLPKNTKIGKVTADNISYLAGVTSSIQTQFDTNINQKITLMNWVTQLLNNVKFE